MNCPPKKAATAMAITTATAVGNATRRPFLRMLCIIHPPYYDVAVIPALVGARRGVNRIADALLRPIAAAL